MELLWRFLALSCFLSRGVLGFTGLGCTSSQLDNARYREVVPGRKSEKRAGPKTAAPLAIREHAQLKRASERTREGSARIAERPTVLSFERAQGAADAGHDPAPGPRHVLWIDEVDAMVRAADAAREVAAAVEHPCPASPQRWAKKDRVTRS
jgi:hypothetical protein